MNGAKSTSENCFFLSVYGLVTHFLISVSTQATWTDQTKWNSYTPVQMSGLCDVKNMKSPQCHRASAGQLVAPQYCKLVEAYKTWSGWCSRLFIYSFTINILHVNLVFIKLLALLRFAVLLLYKLQVVWFYKTQQNHYLSSVAACGSLISRDLKIAV